MHLFFFLIYGRIFYETLESYVQSPDVMKIPYYETSPEGTSLAQSIGYELRDISIHNTRAFFNEEMIMLFLINYEKAFAYAFVLHLKKVF